MSLEDETGLVNVICTKGVCDRYRRSAKALVITGRPQRAEGVINLSAKKFENLSLSLEDYLKARDFR